LFAISNGNADLSAIGLAHFFERSLSAREAGTLKPDPRIFTMLLEQAGLAPDRVAHVGDDPEADVEGARRAGVLPIWLSRDGAPWPAPLPAPSLHIRTLGELRAVLAGLG
jgi:putative hydrolase of the HAD superfamily